MVIPIFEHNKARRFMSSDGVEIYTVTWNIRGVRTFTVSVVDRFCINAADYDEDFASLTDALSFVRTLSPSSWTEIPVRTCGITLDADPVG